MEVNIESQQLFLVVEKGQVDIETPNFIHRDILGDEGRFELVYIDEGKQEEALKTAKYVLVPMSKILLSPAELNQVIRKVVSNLARQNEDYNDVPLDDRIYDALYAKEESSTDVGKDALLNMLKGVSKNKKFKVFSDEYKEPEITPENPAKTFKGIIKNHSFKPMYADLSNQPITTSSAGVWATMDTVATPPETTKQTEPQFATHLYQNPIGNSVPDALLIDDELEQVSSQVSHPYDGMTWFYSFGDSHTRRAQYQYGHWIRTQ